MLISFVVAMDERRLIGANGRLPWHLPADLKYFRRLTMGKPILMGRGTYEAIGRPLPGRHNIVVTHNSYYEAPGCTVVHTVAAGLRAAGEAEEVMVIGGATLFLQLFPQARRIYLTLIREVFTGDTWFPDFDPHGWTEAWREDHGPDPRNPYSYSFIRLERADGKNPGQGEPSAFLN